MPRKALFLDRDGTLIQEVNYLTDPRQIRLEECAAEALRLAREHQLVCILVTNQSAVARGMLSEEALLRIHLRLQGLLEASGTRLDAIYYCPHHPEGTRAEYRRECDCRKPAPGLFFRAAEDLDLNLAESLMVGDRLLDIEAGRRAGCRTALVRTGYGESELGTLSEAPAQPDMVADDLLQCVQWFLEL